MLNHILGVASKGRYIYGRCPDHPAAMKRTGYVLLHRLVVENALGRRLLASEVVHHKDHNTKNNDISNLEVMTRSEHCALHGRASRWAHLTHGTLSSYRYCKCVECRAAKSAHNKTYVARKKSAMPGAP